MTTFTQFQPSANGPFQFQPTLDGGVYNCSVPWLLFGARYYLLCQDLNGNVVFQRALVGSPTGKAIQEASWVENQAYVVTIDPHGFRVGQTAKVSVVGCSPDGYNGTFIVLALDPNTLVYSLSSDPGPCLVVGTVEQNINLAGPYFKTSTLVFRQASQQFEVAP